MINKQSNFGMSSSAYLSGHSPWKKVRLLLVLTFLTMLPLTQAQALNWEFRNSNSTAQLTAVAANGNDSVASNRYVAVGHFGTIITSTNGIDWITQTSGTTADLYGITWNKSQSGFIAVGAGGTILTSSNGDIWSAQSSGTTANIHDIWAHNSRYVAVGAGGLILTSPDSVTWTTQLSNTTANLNGISHRIGNYYVAVGANGTILASTDGTNWYQRISGTNETLYDIAAYQGQQCDPTQICIALYIPNYIAVGANGTRLESDSTGNWSAVSAGSEDLYSVSHQDETFGQVVAVGANGHINMYDSQSAYLGDAIQPINTSLNSITWGDSGYIIVGQNGTLLSSMVANPDSITALTGKTASILDTNSNNVLSNDGYRGTGTKNATLTSGPTSGSLILNANGTFSYTHDGSSTVSDSFRYYLTDGTFSSLPRTVDINIFSNTAPIANNDTNLLTVSKGLSGNSTASVLANDSDADGDALTAVLASLPLYGTLTFNANGTFSYTHNGSNTSYDSFTYYANDGKENSTTVATVGINIVNNAPLANNDSNLLSVSEGLSANSIASVLGNDTDLDGDTLTAILVTPPLYGTLTLNANGTFSYAHDGSETTYDSFTYFANDGQESSTAAATVDIIISPVNDAPVADAGGPYSALPKESVTFNGSNSSDAENGIVSYEWDFGDGRTGSGLSTTHTYKRTGTYTVTLTVTDDDGLSSTSSTTAEISDNSGDTGGTTDESGKQLCRDGLDNDGDGFIDDADPDCANGGKNK